MASEWNLKTSQKSASSAQSTPDTSQGVDAAEVEERLKAEATALNGSTIFVEGDFPEVSANAETNLESVLTRCPFLSIPDAGDYIVTQASNLDNNKPIQFCKEYASLNSKGDLGTKLNPLPPRKRLGPILEIKKVLSGGLWGAAAKVYSAYAADAEVWVALCMDKKVICEVTDPPTEEQLARDEARRASSYPAYVPQEKTSAQATWSEKVKGPPQPKEESVPRTNASSSATEEPSAPSCTTKCRARVAHTIAIPKTLRRLLRLECRPRDQREAPQAIAYREILRTVGLRNTQTR